ncbi:hypothetical protein [Marinisporobacter balticus]|uniref:Uncharacterized protein n=1 Tax=Marinisporobacter balticus TaxID=2018667 RepID=A0A4R2KP72_9FIRM|nr:hypothetical protein [Marinisporobacter balticus]TCO74542.1 hypothetical protein EV214_11218 [Marinisporobacter balticus]
MNRNLKNNFPSMINGFVLKDEQMAQFDAFMQEYGNQPERVIYREIGRVKNEVSEDVLNQHINNLDALSQMQGFVTDVNRKRIANVKSILTSSNASFYRRNSRQSSPSTQFVSGTSLLLWFLILVAIW